MVWAISGALHATALLVVGFFVFFAASKSTGWLRALGGLIGLWLYLLAALSIVAAIVLPMTGGSVFGMNLSEHHRAVWLFRHAPAACPAPAVVGKQMSPAKPAPAPAAKPPG